MKKGFQWMALLVVAMLGACSGGSDKAAAEKVDEKPRVKLAEVSSRPVPWNRFRNTPLRWKPK